MKRRIFHIEPEISSRTSTIRADSPPASSVAVLHEGAGRDDVVADALDQREGLVGVAGAVREHVTGGLLPSPGSCRSGTEATAGSRRSRAQGGQGVGALVGPGAPSRKAATTRRGSAPPPLASAMSSTPTTTSWSSGNCVERAGTHLQSKGPGSRAPGGRRRAADGEPGRRITRLVHRCQKVESGVGAVDRRAGGAVGTVCAGGSGPTRHAMPPASTRWPRRRISVGSSTTAATIAIPTTIIAPSAIERNAWLSTIQIPASEMITAIPEKTTESPEVRERRAASLVGGLGPLRTSSR